MALVTRRRLIGGAIFATVASVLGAGYYAGKPKIDRYLDERAFAAAADELRELKLAHKGNRDLYNAFRTEAAALLGQWVKTIDPQLVVPPDSISLTLTPQGSLTGDVLLSAQVAAKAPGKYFDGALRYDLTWKKPNPAKPIDFSHGISYTPPRALKLRNAVVTGRISKTLPQDAVLALDETALKIDSNAMRALITKHAAIVKQTPPAIPAVK